MDDKDAEAALFSLGPHLEWEEVYSTFWKSQYGRGEQPNYWFWYSIVYECDYYKPAIENTWGGNDAASKLYETLNAAKAACERHHATGKWE